jgi:hypothetical protein
MHTFPSTCGVHASRCTHRFPFQPMLFSPHCCSDKQKTKEGATSWRPGVLGWRVPSRRSCGRWRLIRCYRYMMYNFLFRPSSHFIIYKWCNYICCDITLMMSLYAWIFILGMHKGCIRFAFKNRVWQIWSCLVLELRFASSLACSLFSFGLECLVCSFFS